MHSALSLRLLPWSPSRWAWLEIVGLNLLLVALTTWISPSDPFLLTQPFPWLWLGPLLLALRYGTAAAFASSAVLLASWKLLTLLHHDDSALPVSFFLGGLLLTLLAGEFADLWGSRLRRASEMKGYLGERLEALTRAHYLLKLSHDRLEQQQLTKPVTLYDALLQLRRQLQQPDTAKLPQAGELLRLMGQACQLEVASLYAVDTQRRLLAAPVACIGAATPPPPADPLLQRALARGLLCHVQSEAATVAGSRYLVAAPLCDSAGDMVGLLLVERLPFLSLNHETLRFLAVLAGYYADSLRLLPATRTICALLPRCPPDFAAELLRLHRIQHETGIVSSLLAIVVQPGRRQQEIAQGLRRQARQQDLLWQFQQHHRCFALMLMPLQGDAALTGYVQRLEHWLQESFDVAGTAAGVELHSITLDEPPLLQLRQLLTRCGYVWT